MSCWILLNQFMITVMPGGSKTPAILPAGYTEGSIGTMMLITGFILSITIGVILYNLTGFLGQKKP